MDELLRRYEHILPGNILRDFKKEAAERKLSAKQAEKVLAYLEEQYNKAKIHAGEAIGVITAESFGEPGTQMCISKDETVIIKFKDRIRVLPIGMFIDTVFERVTTKSISTYETYTIPEDLYVLGLSSEERLVWRRVLALNRVKGPKKLLCVTTRSGRTVTATDCHSFVVKRGHHICNVTGRDLHVGDRVPLTPQHPSLLFSLASAIVSDNSTVLHLLSIDEALCGSILWDDIVSLDFIDYKGYVYDLSVPELMTFTTGNGFVVHNTLNVFHFAGVAEVSVTQGLPRLIEILDARKEISTPSMEIYLKSSLSKDPKEVKRGAALIKETKLHEIVSSFSINLSKLQVELELDKAMMRDLKITEDYVEKTLVESLKNVKVKSQDGVIVLKVEAEENELMETYKLKEKVKNLYIKGVKGIEQVLPVKNNQEFVIITSGSNLKDVLEIEDVEDTRTVTNDVFEALAVLGVEAARQVVINEAVKVIEDQGLDVDVRHIMLIADAMTQSGDVKGITRGGITGEKKSVLARASFETPMKHLVGASLAGEEDELNSVIENVMLNQPVPVGTGLPDLVAKMRELFGAGVVLKNEKTEKKAEKDAKEKKG